MAFSDVKPGQWFYEDVMMLTGKGVITGVTKPVNGVGKYDPQGTVTLGQFLAIATRLVASEYIKEVAGQGLDLYSGMKYGDRTLQDGDIGGVWHGDKTYMGQPYWVDEETGEGHFRSDWVRISTYEMQLTLKVKDPRVRQRVGYWTVYFAEIEDWCWTGP